MSLVDRGDEESQNTALPSQVDESKKTSSGNIVLRIVGIVVLVLVVAGIFLYPKVASYGSLYIDNPTEDSVSVKIGDLDTLSIGAKSHQEIDLKPGVYSVAVNDENLGEFTKGAADGKAFLNPTKSAYIKESIPYVVEGTELDDSFEYFDIEVYGQEFWGPFEVLSDLYIKGNWHYGLDELPPEELEGALTDTTIKRKIYRFDDFVKVYNDSYVPFYEENYYYDDEYNYEDVEFIEE